MYFRRTGQRLLRSRFSGGVRPCWRRWATDVAAEYDYAYRVVTAGPDIDQLTNVWIPSYAPLTQATPALKPEVFDDAGIPVARFLASANQYCASNGATPNMLNAGQWAIHSLVARLATLGTGNPFVWSVGNLAGSNFDYMFRTLNTGNQIDSQFIFNTGAALVVVGFTDTANYHNFTTVADAAGYSLLVDGTPTTTALANAGHRQNLQDYQLCQRPDRASGVTPDIMFRHSVLTRFSNSPTAAEVAAQDSCVQTLVP